MCAAQKKILPFAQISTAENVQYANCFAVFSFCDYIIAQPMYQKTAMSGFILSKCISQRFGDLLTQALWRQHLNCICKLYCPVKH